MPEKLGAFLKKFPDEELFVNYLATMSSRTVHEPVRCPYGLLRAVESLGRATP